MSKTNKLISLLLSILMVLSLVMPVQAVEPNANDVQSSAFNGQIATVIFTVSWDTDNNTESKQLNLAKDESRIETFEQLPPIEVVTFTSSNPKVATVEPYYKPENTSFNNFNNYSYENLAIDFNKAVILHRVLNNFYKLNGLH